MNYDKQTVIDGLKRTIEQNEEKIIEYSKPYDARKRRTRALEKYGILPDEISNAGKAALYLDRLHKRQSEGLTTPKQIRFLEGRGFKGVGMWQFDQAKNMIDRIAANGWRLPAGVRPAEYVPG